MKPRWISGTLLGLAISGTPAFAALPAHPGTVNYVEGAASLEGQPLNYKDVGNATLDAGQDLNTAKGKAEILLTPGVFLRVDDHSVVKLISPDLTLTQVALEKGRAGVEVDELHQQNDLQIIDAGVTTRLDKTGYYEFNADQPEVKVFNGMAKTEVADGKWRKIKSSHELMLTPGENGEALAKEKPAAFDTHTPDELYNWSSLRSQYLAEANNQIAGDYAASGFYPGWYWNPYGWGYTFIGAGPFYSPFGWGFYPFGWGGWGGGWYGGWGGWYSPGLYRHGFRYGGFPHGRLHAGTGDRFHGGSVGGFHGGTHDAMSGGFNGGGFHGGGGSHR